MFPVFAVRARESLRARIACLRSNKAACRGALYLRLTPADPIKSHTLPLSLLYKIPYSFERSLFPALPSEAPGRLLLIPLLSARNAPLMCCKPPCCAGLLPVRSAAALHGASVRNILSEALHTASNRRFHTVRSPGSLSDAGCQKHPMPPGRGFAQIPISGRWQNTLSS